jgi:uncharacterized protein (DUF1501 family)
MSSPTRRDFLKKLMLGAESTAGGNKSGTVVCIFLRGGADTLNMFVPFGDDEYYKSRPTIAIKRPQSGVADCAIKATDFYGFHPKLAPLLPIFSEGRLGIVQSVGSDNPSGSHFEAQDQIEHGIACGQQYSGGWLGRHLQTRAKFATSPLCAVAIGATLPESMRGAPSASAITSIDTIRLETPAADTKAVASALASLYDCDIALLRAPGRDTLELLRKVENLRDQKYVPSSASYPDTDFGRGLKEVARLIKANVGLEVASIDLGGWDTHFFQGSVTGIQAQLIDELARSLAALDKDIINHRNSVTVIVQTEFGRRTYENGSLGTDHGRGFALMAIGNNVNGGTIHGDWTGLSKQDIDIIGPAGLPITFDYRSVLSELLVSATGNHHMSEVFPNFVPQPVGLIKSGSLPLA